MWYVLKGIFTCVQFLADSRRGCQILWSCPPYVFEIVFHCSWSLLLWLVDTESIGVLGFLAQLRNTKAIKQVGEESAYSVCTWALLFITEGSQDRILEAGAIEKCCLLACFPLACSAHLLLEGRIRSPGMAPPTMAEPSPFITNWEMPGSCGRISSAEALFSLMTLCLCQVDTRN